MKKFVFTLVMSIMLLPTMANAQEDSELNSDQLQLRAELFSFIKEEGFLPEIDSDGDIKFKSEGYNYYISISKNDENPMYIVLYRPFLYPESYSMETFIMASRNLNLYKGIKVVCYESSYRICAQLFVRDAEPFKASFYKLKSIIEMAKSDVLDECESVGTLSNSYSSGLNIPFLISSMEVANTDSDGSIIQGYGSTIYDFKSKYLKPKITIQPISSSGSYTVYAKLYKDNVLQRNPNSSPEDYTFSCDVTINGSSSQVIELSGWGSKTAGQWAIGTYRYEIWYNGYCLGSKTFRVI